MRPVNNFTITFILAVFFIAAAPVAQEKKVLELRPIQGLNTRAGLFSLEPTELTRAIDIIYDPVGAFRMRRGYDSVSVISGMDSIIHGGLFTAQWNDGTQQLVMIADSNGTGYGGIYLSALGSVNIKDSTTKIWERWSVNNRTLVQQHRDRLYIGNGSHRPIIYDKNSKTSRELPLRTSGEPSIVPLNTPGPLYGEYFYRVSSSGGGFAGTSGGSGQNSEGFISSRIKVDSGQVLLMNFSEPPSDSIDYPRRIYGRAVVIKVDDNFTYEFVIDATTITFTSDGTATVTEIVEGLASDANSSKGGVITAWGLDSTVYIVSDADLSTAWTMDSITTGDTLELTYQTQWAFNIYRTRANPGQLDSQDSALLVYSATITWNDTLFIDTLTVIDSVSDATAYTALLYTRIMYGRDSLGVTGFRHGAPRYISAHQAASVGDYGVYGGWGGLTTFLGGVAYFVTIQDTIVGVESDTSRGCYIFRDVGATDTAIVYEISLPRLDTVSQGSGLVNLYRATIIKIPSDSSILFDTTITWIRGYQPGSIFDPASKQYFYRFVKTRTMYEIDSSYITSPVRIAQLSDTIRTYQDSLRYDSLTIGGDSLRVLYVQASAPPLMKGLFTFQDRMFSWQGSRLYYSDLDAEIINVSITDWQEWNQIVIDEGDGDEITFAYPARDYILVKKNTKSYIVYQTDDGFRTQIAFDGLWPNVDYLGGYGCIAPLSFKDAPEGYYYLSNHGVLLENESTQRTRARIPVNISSKLDNFDKLSIDVKAKAVSAYIPYEQRYLMSIPSLDTTWVWDFRAQQWSTWTFAMSAATLYRAENKPENLPGDTLYFVLPGDSVLMRYGGSGADNGVGLVPIVTFAPSFVDRNIETITDIAVWSQSTDTSSSPIKLRGKNELSNVIISESIAGTLNNNRYFLQSVPPNQSLYFQLEITGNVNHELDTTIFNGFEIWYIKQGFGLDE